MILTLMETSPISFERKKGRVRGKKKTFVRPRRQWLRSKMPFRSGLVYSSREFRNVVKEKKKQTRNAPLCFFARCVAAAAKRHSPLGHRGNKANQSEALMRRSLCRSGFCVRGARARARAHSPVNICLVNEATGAITIR